MREEEAALKASFMARLEAGGDNDTARQLRKEIDEAAKLDKLSAESTTDLLNAFRVFFPEYRGPEFVEHTRSRNPVIVPPALEPWGKPLDQLAPWEKDRYWMAFRRVLVSLARVNQKRGETYDTSTSHISCPCCEESVFWAELPFHDCKLGQSLISRYRTAVRQAGLYQQASPGQRISIWEGFVEAAVRQEEAFQEVAEDFAVCPDCSELVVSTSALRHTCKTAQHAQARVKALLQEKREADAVKKAARKSRKKEATP